MRTIISKRRFGLSAATCLTLAAGVAVGTAGRAPAADPPPAQPQAVNGHTVTTPAHGVATPTSFAFDSARGIVFVGAFGNPETGKGGGVLALHGDGTSAQIPSVPSGVAGTVFREGTLYVSVNGPKGGRIMAFKGWDGTRFASSGTIFRAARTVGNINGIAWGPDGRLYGGAGLVEDIRSNGTVKKSTFPHPYTVFSIRPDGSHFRVLARGVRQPWQMTFVGRSANPYVSVLSQETGKIPPDAIVRARTGQDYGFPKCFAHVGIACRGTHLAQPLITLPRHASPMGIQAVGHTLYVALFGGIGKSGPEVVTIPAKHGGKPKPLITGFPAPVVAVGVSAGVLYAGDLTGAIYRVTL